MIAPVTPGFPARPTLLDFDTPDDRVILHPKQWDYETSEARYNVVPAGRRSGKTVIAKRRLWRKVWEWKPWSDPWYVVGAPTHAQAKRIYWTDLKRMFPRELLRSDPLESTLTLQLCNGADITVMGLDVARRLEGRPLDWIFIDEIADMKAGLWEAHIRPALTDRLGGADFYGVPEGRNHFHKLWLNAKADTTGEWRAFGWKTIEVLKYYLGRKAAAKEIAAARNDLDTLTYEQEYEASFVNFSGRAYYPFDWDVHAKHRVAYSPGLPIAFCFDFNIKPGVAAVVQEQVHRNPSLVAMKIASQHTAVVGEVWIDTNSNTPLVCKKLAKDWAHHTGEVHVYGDATGGSGGTAKVAGSDWDLVQQELRPVFGQRLKMRISKANPPERVRINCMNRRLQTTTGLVRMLVDPKNARHVAEDLDGVVVVKGGAGDLDKKYDKMLTHMSDALGYYIHKKHPLKTGSSVSVTEF